MKSLKALCTGVMTLCVASLSLTSCYDDSELNSKINELGNEVSALDARLQAVEALTAKLEALTARVDALYTLKFQVTTTNELQYSFDGGTTWVSTGIVLAKELECDCEEPVEVSLVDNGDSVTIKVGDQEFTIEKPQEIVFDIRAGKVYFESEGTQKVAIKASGIEDLTVISVPKGWSAEIASDGMLEVTAPNYEETQEEYNYDTDEIIPGKYAAEGYVKVHACAADGKCMVGKLPVIVSNRPVHVKAYAGNAYFNATGARPATFYYGVSTRASFEAEVAGLLAALNQMGNPDGYNTNFDEETYMAAPSVEAPIADLLGSEPKAGVEYVVWALVEDYSKVEYTMEDFIISYYSLIEVTAVENEAERTAYNVTVTVEVNGADSYYALAVPANYYEEYDQEGNLDEEATAEALLMYKENLLGSLSPDSWSGPMGKLYTESYTGSVLDIAEGTTASMSGNYAPDMNIALIILPLDGRSWDEYTLKDIHDFEFRTAALAAGGSVNANATQVFKYMAEGYDESWNWIKYEKIVDEYSQLAVEVKPSSDNWTAFYFNWYDDETFKANSSDEALVALLLKEYGMTPGDVDAFPVYDCLDTDPETTMHFVAMFVDNAGKYGQIAKVSATTKKLEYSDILLKDPCETNLQDGFLKNTTDFKVKIETEGGTASAVKYYWLQTNYYNPYEEMTDAELAQTIHFDRDKRAVEVKAADLSDGYLVVPNNAYGSSYMVAVLPYDENGAPAKSAAIFEYESVFALDAVTTEGEGFDATVPEITINLPEEFYADGAFGDASYYGYKYEGYYKKYQFYYELNYVVKPVEGTTVSAVLTNYALEADAVGKASQVWQGSLGSSYTIVATEETEASYRYFNHYEDKAAPDVYLCVSWSDADGNYYYKEYALQAELQKLADEMKEYLASPDGKQLAFTWEEMQGAPSCLDFGVTTEGQFAVAYDMAAVYGDNLPAEMAGMYMQYMAWEYEVTPADAHSGTIVIKSYDMYGDLQTTEGTYSDWYGSSCKVTFEMLYLDNTEMTVATEKIPLYIEATGGGAL